MINHPLEDGKTFLGEQKRLNRVRQNDELLIFHKAPFYEMKRRPYNRNARLWTRPRMSQLSAPFKPGTDEYRRWRNIVYFNGELCDILRHICEKEDNDPSLRGKLDDIKNEVRSLRDTMDYYDGQGHTEFGHPVDRVPTFQMDEYSGISSSSEDEKELNRAFPQVDGEQLFGPSQPANQSRNDSSSSYYYEYEEEEEKPKRPRTREEKKHTVWFFDPKPDYDDFPPLIMYRYSYSSDGEDGRWEGPTWKDLNLQPPKLDPE